MCAKAKIKKPQDTNHCRECAFCEIETKFVTLSLKGEPTLGRCPHYTNKEYCVLLSQRACEMFIMKDGKAKTS